MTDHASRIAAHRRAFRALHESGCFVLPNPWDVGSGRYLRHLGFKALATTSAGYAFARGLPDGAADAVSLEEALDHFAELAHECDLPLNADFQSGYADAPEGVAANVQRCVDTGVSGLSIEDATGDAARPLYELALARERIRAARESIDASGTGVVLTARAECYLVGHADPLHESIRRLQAYAEAGADVLYAPGCSGRAAIEAIVAAVAPRPVNVLMGWNEGLAVSDLAAMGARRVSVGAALARAAWTGFIRAASAIAEQGSFAGFDQTVPFSELNAFFTRDARERVG
jgi:2-methylisocitrate lyase-like PEP mutase family enzyme